VTQAEKGQAFRALHEGDPFVIPNPWDAGSARVLEALDFKALATTSGGIAMAAGRLDGRLSLDEMIDATRPIVDATELPVSVDLENGFGPEPADAANAITRAAEAGAVGGSIEDFDHERGIYERDLAVERVAAAVQAARALDFPFTLTARAEGVFRGVGDLDDAIARLEVYEEAGADVIYAPGLGTVEEIRAVRAATSAPINVLARSGLSFAAITEAGAQRISVGSRLALVALAAFAESAGRIRDEGDFSSLKVRVPLDEWFGD
jgi:2-methylisocitrate lyase-like PEP mutase family enzyme